MSKLITVFGATGNQGGSVISTIVDHPELSKKYKLRAITRDPSKPSAQALASKGVELTKADLNDKESVKKAIDGSYGVFAVTNYWETTSKDTEVSQGKNIVDACKDTGVQHLVWAGLPHVSTITNGELTKVEHFDGKAEVSDYANKHKGSMFVTTSMPAFFMSNIVGQLKPGEDGSITLAQPWNATETQLALIDINRDTGKFVAGILEAGKAADGVTVHAVSEWTTPQALVDTISKATGKDVGFKQTDMSVEAAAKMDRIPEELMQNMMLIRDFSYYGKGTEKEQAKSDEFFLKGAKKETWAEFAKTAKWQF